MKLRVDTCRRNARKEVAKSGIVVLPCGAGPLGASRFERVFGWLMTRQSRSMDHPMSSEMSALKLTIVIHWDIPKVT